VSDGRRRGLIALAGLLAILLAFTVDRPIARAMAGVNPVVRGIAGVVTRFGEGGVVLYPTGFLVVAGLAVSMALPGSADRLGGPIRKVASVFIIVAAAGLADDALKIVFGRARPYLWLAGDNSGFGFFRYSAKFASFPSGHTTTSFAAALALGILLPHYKPWFLLAALLIGLSRIILDVHYLSDVIAGALLGAVVAVLLVNRLERQGWLPLRGPQDSRSFGVVAEGSKKTGGKRN
jgi:membrane-associated phospholipid phosphatase